MSWSALSFANPWWLLLLASLPALAWWHHRQGGVGALVYSRLPAGAGSSWRLHIPFYLRLLGLAALVVALARPQTGYSWEESLTEGIDIEIALDLSGSMGAEDFQPKNRLTVAKQVIRDFVDQRPADRLGLVVFAGGALTRTPLTTDRKMLDELIDSLELNTMRDGTAIGVGLANAASRLKDSAAKTRVIVLVTDGVNNAGEIDPLSAAAVCKGLGIKVYTIGVGTAEGPVPVPVQVRNPLTGQIETQRVMMITTVDEKLLAEIASRTGGQFYRATDARTLSRIFAEINALEKTPLQVKRYVRYQEGFMPLAWAALACLLAPLALAAAGVTADP
jgi:Ca-activated chloride channel family protein